MKWKEIHYNVKASAVAFAIGVAGLIYIAHMPKPQITYNPREVKTPTYDLIDADRDNDVDIIERKDRGTLIAEDMVFWLRNNHPNAFISLSPRMTPQLQEAANKRLNGDDVSNFEKLLTQTFSK